MNETANDLVKMVMVSKLKGKHYWKNDKSQREKKTEPMKERRKESKKGRKKERKQSKKLNPFTRIGPLVTNAVQKYGSRIPADLSSCCSQIVMLVKEWTSGGAGELQN